MKFRLHYFLAFCLAVGTIGAFTFRYVTRMDLPRSAREVIRRVESSIEPITYENFERICDLSYVDGEPSDTVGMSHSVSWKLSEDYHSEIHVNELETDGIVAMALF